MLRFTRQIAVFATVALALLPSMARAQMAVRHSATLFNGVPAPIIPVSLARVVLESDDKDLALTDSQRVQLRLVQKQLDSVNAPLIAKLDSIKPTWRPAGGLNDLSAEQRDQLVAYRKGHDEIIEKIAPNVAASREHAMALLSKDQQERAVKLEKNARKRAEEIAKRELQELENPIGGMRRPPRQRGQIRDATGRTPLG
jgi:nitrogen-specific signal transduction histidine kinase